MSDSETPEIIRHAQAAGGTAPGGAPHGAPHVEAFSSLVDRLRSADSPWRAVIVKGASIGAAMLALAAIGIYSGRAGGTAPLAPLSSATAAALHASHGLSSSWLAGAGLPSVEAPAPSGTETSGPDSVPIVKPGLTPDGKVILNTADVADFERLPGVGKKRAEQILDLRNKLGGRFKKPTDLLRIRGIGVKSLKKMLPHLVLDPPAAAPPSTAP